MGLKRWVGFSVCSGLFLMSMLFRSSSAVIAPDLARDLAIGPESLGLLGAAFFYASGLAQLPLGVTLDRIGSRRTMIWLNLVGGLGAVIFSQASSLAWSLTGRALLGLGMSSNLMGPFNLFTKWFKPHEFATVSGLMVSIGALGAILATTPLVLLVQELNWRGAYLLLAFVNLSLTIGLALLVQDEPPEKTGAPAPARPASALESLGTLMKEPSYWAIAFSAGLRYGAFAAIQTLWAGPFLILYLGLPPVTAGNLLLLISIGVIVGAPAGGFFSDRIIRSRKKAILLSLTAMAACVLILALWPGPTHLVLLAAIMFTFGLMGFSGQLAYAHIKELMPGRMAGTAMTGVNFFVFIGAGFFVQGLGYVLQRSAGTGLESGRDYRTAFLLCFAALALSALAEAFSRDAAVRG
ncbi:MAG: MFS transporter [Thermodesulfobacteriota bacterium]